MTSEETQQLYEELAGRFDRQQEFRHRDLFLVLAADAALTGGRGGEAERLRARLLQSNPHHLLKPFPTMREALMSGDIRDYVADLRRRYPTTNAEEMLQKLRAREPKPATAFAPALEPELPAPRDATPPKRSEPFKPIEREPFKLAPIQPELPSPTVPRGHGVGGEGENIPKAPFAFADNTPVVDRPTSPKTTSPPKRPPTRSPYETAPDAEPPQKADSGDEPVGRWFATFFFLLALVLGVGVTALIFLRPFIPVGPQ